MKPGREGSDRWWLGKGSVDDHSGRDMVALQAQSPGGSYGLSLGWQRRKLSPREADGRRGHPVRWCHSSVMWRTDWLKSPYSSSREMEARRGGGPQSQAVPWEDSE